MHRELKLPSSKLRDKNIHSKQETKAIQCIATGSDPKNLKFRSRDHANFDKENQMSALNRNQNKPNQQDHRQKNAFTSPERTTLQFFSGFRSNKAKQTGVEAKQIQPFSSDNTSTIIYSGISKDGKYKITSRCLEGSQLEKAVEHEHSSSITCKKENQNDMKLPPIDSSKTSSKQNGVIKSYAVNTHQGISRNYNEDRVSITLNINKNGLKAQFFAVYDGHGGTTCCDYLKDNLHQFIINHKEFPGDPKRAISESILLCESRFLSQTKKKFIETGNLDRSGSCGLIVMVVGEDCFVANVGDSRAIISTEGGKFAFNLTKDHKPTEEKEQKRIFTHGGKVYRTEMRRILDKKQQIYDESEVIIGPLRVFPGKLSVSRTVGDIEAKEQEFGGLPHCITVQPEIRKFKLSSKEDFIFIGCDGIFEKLQSADVIKTIWETIRKHQKDSIHEVAGKCVQEVLKQSMKRKSSDNLTAIIICFNDLTTLKTPRDFEKKLVVNYNSP